MTTLGDIHTIEEEGSSQGQSGDTSDRPGSGDLTIGDRLVLEVGDDDVRPATTTGRIPSQQSRARLSRSSIYNNSDNDGESSDEQNDDVTGSGSVLITELRDEPEEPVIQPPQLTKSHRRKPKKPRPKEINDDDEWDTDLEIEGEEKVNEHDPTGRLAYGKLCEKLGVVPVSYFTRHITDTDITMRYHGLGPSGTHAIAKVLRNNITLERLNLSGNWMEGEGGMHMAKMLIDNDYITDLSLADNKLGQVGAYHMSRMLIVNNGLRKLDLSGNSFGDAEAEVLANAIEQNKFLKELILSHNHFGEVAGELLGPAIGQNDILEYIDLSWNQLRRKGAVAVARGIKENVRLKRCNLAWNGFGQEGGPAIADAIGANEALLELDISGNRLDTAALIAKALRKNEEIRTFKMGNNPITTSGAINLITAIHEQADNCVLEELDLTDIPVEFEFLRTVEEIQRSRPFSVKYGAVLRSGNTSDDIGKAPIDPYPKDPLIVLREHIIVNDFRILDILQRLDEEKVLSVTPEQFASALEELGVRHTRGQLDEIATKLDKNDDGRIYYGDILKQAEDIKAAKAQQDGTNDGMNINAESLGQLSNGKNSQTAPKYDRSTSEMTVSASRKDSTDSTLNASGKLNLSKKEITAE